MIGNANWHGAVGVAHADGSVRSAGRGRGGGAVRGGSSAASISPNPGVSFVYILFYTSF